MAKKTIELKNCSIGKNLAVFMVAEVGINHNGSIEIVKKLVDAAFACNWNCVKFQKRTPELCVPEHQKNMERETPWGKMSYLEYRYKVEFGMNEYTYIDKYCAEKPIYWSASVWDIPSLEFLMKFNVPFIKIPSAKLTQVDLLVEASKTRKPVILSTGMSTLEEIDQAVNVLEKYSHEYALLHTTSSYPAPQEDLNLLVIRKLIERYDCIVGYSGHEYDLEPSVVAVALGARIVERHITLDHNMWGSDQFASLEVHAMDMLYKRIKGIDIMLGDGIKKLSPKELDIRKKLRGV
jgi:N-acetylneuraminate synthase